MRAYLIATTAVLGLGVLAACGSQATPAASDQTSTSQSVATPKSSPEPPSNVAEPTPGNGAKPRDPTSGEAPVTIGPNGPVVPPGVTEVPAKQVDAVALPNYFEYGNKVWSFEGGFSLQFFAAASSSCTGVEARVVDQSTDSVKILVQPMDSPQGGRPDGGACAMVMTPMPVTVTLDTPLQDRKILLSGGR
ncbi:hypothetical protein [Actinophytocola oryzae]|uniref:Uncharacterized protein n=1 Tax=Actinophytocola oryzae TaxID=502181 RepID=A0A4R7UW84_9PSEU|nr:hypothetical protein [Actinophytocola oryzae]TDV40324.1 hypothetical protein CLV71_12334 [Actinophytocola oryzae]